MQSLKNKLSRIYIVNSLLNELGIANALIDEKIDLHRFEESWEEDARDSSLLSVSFPNDSGRVISKGIFKQISFRDCVIKELDALACAFYRPIEFIDCVFERVSLAGTCYPAGLVIENCEFLGRVDFNAGGHNRRDKAIRLVNNTFHEFVNFFDCSFTGPVEVINCQFLGGTNLLGKWAADSKDPATDFAFSPMIKSNSGIMAIDGENWPEEYF